MKNIIALSLFSLVFSVAACGDDGGDGNPGGGDGGVDEIPSLSASGSIVDFSTGDALTGGATVSADGLVPAPTISVTGSNFEITGIPPFSNFHLLAGSPPDYRSTYSTVVLVEDTNRTGLVVEALSEDFIDSLYSTFGVTEANGTSLVVAKLVDDQGAPVADVEAAAFELPATTDGPYFLDADKAPDALLTKSSSSGYVVDGALVIPTGVSFSADITPLFEDRGCTVCHSGSGPGKDLGGLHLNGESNKMYKELVEEVSAKHAKVRVDIGIPADSLMLTFPSKEDPPDIHPNVTFLSSSDPDYLLMLGWITEGALNN
jgi:hypothetical protein